MPFFFLLRIEGCAPVLAGQWAISVDRVHKEDDNNNNNFDERPLALMINVYGIGGKEKDTPRTRTLFCTLLHPLEDCKDLLKDEGGNSFFLLSSEFHTEIDSQVRLNFTPNIYISKKKVDSFYFINSLLKKFFFLLK